MDSSLSADQKATLEGKVLEEVEEASATLKTLHATLWKAFEGTAGIQDSFCKVVAASKTLTSMISGDSLASLRTVSLLRIVSTGGCRLQARPRNRGQWQGQRCIEVSLLNSDYVSCFWFIVGLNPSLWLHAECLPTPRRLTSHGSFSLTHPTSQHNLQKGRHQRTVQQALPPSTWSWSHPSFFI